MGRIAAVVSDPADQREFDCLLPDDVPVGLVAARLAELARFPCLMPDASPIQYAFAARGGGIIGSEATLGEVELPEPFRMRLIPELLVGSGEGDLFAGVDDLREADPVDVLLGEERCLAHDDGLNLRLDVRLAAETHQAIEDFASRDRFLECAGLLLGEVGVERKARVANIRAIAPAHGAVESRTEVKLTFCSWQSMLAIRDEKYPDLRVLGWFHTHAGWGVFLSETDLFIQRHFFAHPNMVAYVLDPTIGRESFFRWQDGQVVQCPTYGLVSSSSASPSHTKTGARGVRTLAAGAAAIVLAGGLYAGFRGLNTPPRHEVKAAVETVAAKPAPVPKPSVRVHVLGRHENLWIVCNRVYGDGELAAALAEYNGIKSFSGLQVGQQIKLPPKEVLEKGQHDR